MALRPVNVSISVGKGVDESADDFVRQAPLSTTAANVRPEAEGSLRRRPGFEALHGVVGGEHASVLVSDGDARALLLGTSPAQIISTDGAGELEHASPMPLNLRTHRLRAVQGFGHCAQLAHAGGYTAIAISVLGDVTTFATGATPGDSIQLDYQTEVAIYDADWRIAWGPYRLPELKWLPRVEAITVDGVTRFVFFALGAASIVAEFPWQKGVLTEQIFLYTAQGFVGGGAPSATQVSEVSAVECDGPERRFKIYDTHSDPSEALAYATFVRPNASYDLRIIGTDGDGAPAEQLDIALSATDRDHSVSIWRDAATDTVLVHHTGEAKIYYAEGTLAAALSIAGPTLDGVGASSTVDDFAGSVEAYQVPEFYIHSNGNLFLNEQTITLTGSEPAVPSLGVTITPALAHLYKPRALAGETMFTRAQVVSAIVGRGSHLELYHLEEHPSYSAPRPIVDLAILESRWGAESLGHYTFETYLGDTNPVTAPCPCVVGQNALTDDGRLLIPALPLTDQQRVRAEMSTTSDPAFSTSLLNRETYSTIGAGAGYYNDEQYLVVIEIDATAPVYSAETHEASTLVAAGLPSMWSGAMVHPVVPRRPTISYTQPDVVAPPASRHVGTQAVGLIDASSGGTANVDYGRAFMARAVLVFTDANGIEYRSAPSHAITVGGVTNGGTFPTALPVVSVNFEPQVLSFLGAGRSLDVEFYVTERRDAAGGDPDETTYTMVSRMPLQKDDDGWFVLDTMQDLVLELDSLGGAFVDEFRSPPHVTPLYTLSGEKENLPPPASYVSAQVAGYAFLLSVENEYEVWSSKPLVKGRGPEWSPELITYAPPACGGVVSLASGYDRLFLLCRRGVWEQAVFDGPSNTGGGFASPPQIVYRGAGCISHMGTVETPAGVFYVTKSGPRVLANGTSVDVGKAVRTAIDWTAVRAATYDAEQDEVTWWTEDGSVSYSLRFEAWSTSTLRTLAAAVWSGGVLRLRAPSAPGATSTLVQETRSSTSDAGRYVQGTVTTPWLSFGDVQGYKRVWEVQVLGRINSSDVGDIVVSLEYDYVDGVVDSYKWPIADVLALSKGFQLSVKPKRQQVDAIRISVSDTGTLIPGEGQSPPLIISDIDWTITGINVRVGAKAGLMKLQAEAKK